MPTSTPEDTLAAARAALGALEITTDDVRELVAEDLKTLEDALDELATQIEEADRQRHAREDAEDEHRRVVEDLEEELSDARAHLETARETADAMEEERDEARAELDEARGGAVRALRELADLAQSVATSDPHDPAWGLYEELWKRIDLLTTTPEILPGPPPAKRPRGGR